jgi:hypothetical protein
MLGMSVKVRLGADSIRSSVVTLSDAVFESVGEASGFRTKYDTISSTPSLAHMDLKYVPPSQRLGSIGMRCSPMKVSSCLRRKETVHLSGEKISEYKIDA